MTRRIDNVTFSIGLQLKQLLEKAAATGERLSPMQPTVNPRMVKAKTTIRKTQYYKYNSCLSTVPIWRQQTVYQCVESTKRAYKHCL